MSDTPQPPVGRSQTISEFCAAENIGNATYYKMKKAGIGPEETRIPGTKVVRISPQARAEWHARMRHRSRERDAYIEHLRRQATEAARRSVASPHHVSRRKRGRADAR
jgi:hypothetical protein